ncbi:MAG: LacI family DNA-binding transcriptional regulator [Actinomycetota bacterium]
MEALSSQLEMEQRVEGRTPDVLDEGGSTGRQPAPTLDEVARVSGVSRAAASRALNGRGGVRDDVRERVRHVAASLGYRPNRSAQNLAGGRASVIGLVMPSEELQLDLYGASILQAVADAADRHDQGLMLHLTRTEPSRAVGDMMRDGLIDGVIVSAKALGRRWVDEVLDAGMPTVLIGGRTDRRGVHAVVVENVRSVGQLVEHLHEEGCRRIAHVRGPANRADALERERGYLEALGRLGLPVLSELIVDGDFTRESGRRVTPSLLEHRPDAIVAANDEMAIGTMHAIEAAGRSVPGDVCVVGFDGTEPHGVAITTARQPFADMGELAVRTLIGVIAGHEVPNEQVVEPTIVITATSLRRND